MLSVSAITPSSKTVLVDKALCPKPTACTRQTINWPLNKAWSTPKLSCSVVDIAKVVIRWAVRLQELEARHLMI